MGLNSKTFNYLQAHGEDALNLKPELKTLQAVGTNMKTFYTHCVSYSRACKLNDVAKAWPAYKHWRYESTTRGNRGYQYLLDKLGNRDATVFVD